jgi:hypothetical protein
LTLQAGYAASRISSNLKGSTKQFGWLQAPATKRFKRLRATAPNDGGTIGNIKGPRARGPFHFPVLSAALTPSAQSCCLLFVCSLTLQIRTRSWWSEYSRAASTPAALSREHLFRPTTIDTCGGRCAIRSSRFRVSRQQV